MEVVRLLVRDHNKSVYVGGLDGDYKMNKFGQILDLIPLCDKIEKLHAICSMCKKPAPFTKRLTNETEQTVIGSDNYIPVCRACHKLN
jgi:thymidine kinase